MEAQRIVCSLLVVSPPHLNSASTCITSHWMWSIYVLTAVWAQETCSWSLTATETTYGELTYLHSHSTSLQESLNFPPLLFPFLFLGSDGHYFQKLVFYSCAACETIAPNVLKFTESLSKVFKSYSVLLLLNIWPKATCSQNMDISVCLVCAERPEKNKKNISERIGAKHEYELSHLSLKNKG